MPNGIENGNEGAKYNFEAGLFTNESNISLPIGIFSNGASGLESISKYLKDKVGLRYCTIADLLNRDDRTIWGAHKSANEKSNGNSSSRGLWNSSDKISVEESTVKIPLSIFKDRSLSILESLAEYLKEELNLRYCKIAVLLNKDQRTIWTVYNRAKKKRNRNVKEN